MKPEEQIKATDKYTRRRRAQTLNNWTWPHDLVGKPLMFDAMTREEKKPQMTKLVLLCDELDRAHEK